MSGILLGTVSRRRRVRDRTATAAIWLSVLVAAVPLAFVLVYLVQRGAGTVSWDFLTDDIPISSRLPGPGMGPAVLGNAGQPFEAAIDRAWGAALTLIVLVFVLTAVARVIARRFTVR